MDFFYALMNLALYFLPFSFEPIILLKTNEG
jgi:hypothetical protein